AARLRPRHAHVDRVRAVPRRLRLLQRLSRRAPDARRQDHPDLGRHQPGPSPAHRTELQNPMTTPIKTVAVCGAGGTMGAGIALVAARAGFRTLCYDTQGAGLAAARKRAERFFGKSVERGKMTESERDAALGNLVDTTDLGALSQADLVIEAIFENLDVKRELFSRLDAICG